MALPRTWTLLGEYYIPHRIQLLARMIDRETGRELQAEFNLSVADWRVLALTSTLGGSTAVEICNAFEIDRAEVSRAVARLLKAGLVRREADPGNRTRKNILPTERGRDVFERAVEKRQAYFAHIMQDISPEDIRRLGEMISSIAQRVDALRSASESCENLAVED
jgi:DNA-binding MarR family transcriptional regulator